MAFAQANVPGQRTGKNLWDIEACLGAQPDKLHHLGIRGNVTRSNLAEASEARDGCIHCEFAQAVIRMARRLYRYESLAVDRGFRLMGPQVIQQAPLWRSLKYEAVYFHEISDGFQAQRLTSRWFALHSALGGSTPAEAYPSLSLPTESRGQVSSLQDAAHQLMLVAVELAVDFALVASCGNETIP